MLFTNLGETLDSVPSEIVLGFNKHTGVVVFAQKQENFRKFRMNSVWKLGKIQKNSEKIRIIWDEKEKEIPKIEPINRFGGISAFSIMIFLKTCHGHCGYPQGSPQRV